jgi:Ser/Thr protein kinase RdoA (MazF antagonist)
MTDTMPSLRKFALNALQHYDLDIRDVRLVGQFTNTLFRARTTDGKSYGVRVCRPNWRTPDDLRSEAAWLEALSRDPHIGAPAPVKTRSGDYVVEMVGETGEARRCVVSTWIPGVPMEKRMTEENFTKMGALFTRLHEQALIFTPPPGFTALRMDSIYARGETDMLFDQRYRYAFTPRSREIYAGTRQVVEETFASLFSQPGLRLIHDDLAHGNIIVNHGRLHPLDFEDIIWGYPVHDIAMAMFDLGREVPPDDYERLRACFRAGYESRLPWPERAPGEVDTFIAGRMIWVTNYVARYEEEYLERHIAWNARVFEHFLESGEVSFRYR